MAGEMFNYMGFTFQSTSALSPQMLLYQSMFLHITVDMAGSWKDISFYICKSIKLYIYTDIYTYLFVYIKNSFFSAAILKTRKTYTAYEIKNIRNLPPGVLHF